LGSSEVDDTFRARLEIADKISPAQMGAVNAAMERAVGETALSLESQMILLATAVSGSPFSACLAPSGAGWMPLPALPRLVPLTWFRWRQVFRVRLSQRSPRSVSRSQRCSVTTFSLPASAESSSRWTILPPNSLPNSSTNTSITAYVNRHFV